MKPNAKDSDACVTRLASRARGILSGGSETRRSPITADEARNLTPLVLPSDDKPTEETKADNPTLHLGPRLNFFSLYNGHSGDCRSRGGERSFDRFIIIHAVSTPRVISVSGSHPRLGLQIGYTESPACKHTSISRQVNAYLFTHTAQC
jgi:hypothetical protein